jgi:hypothetical protein
METATDSAAKKCTKCGLFVPMVGYRICHRTKDGRTARCRRCEAEIARTRYHSDESYRENKKRHYKWLVDTGRRAAYARQKYRERRPIRTYNPEAACKGRQKYNKQNPEKYAAWTAVRTALKNGSLIRKPCCVCNNPNSQAHHEDYSKALDVMWLCKNHHHAWHNVFYVEQPHD